MLDRYMVSYNYEESILHTLNPIVKFISFILFFISLFFKFDLIIFIASIVWVFTLIMFSNISIKQYLKVLWNYKYILILIYILLLHTEMEPVFIHVVMFKIVFCLLYFYLILFTTTKRDFSKGLGNIFNVGLNEKKVSNIFSTIYVYICTFIEVVNDNYDIYSIKGEDKIFINVINKTIFFIHNIKNNILETNARMDEYKSDMKHRMYDSSTRYKYKYRSKLNVFDYILLIFFLSIYVYYIIKVR